MFRKQISIGAEEKKYRFMQEMKRAKKKKGNALRAAAGMWKKREDLLDVQSLRKEFDREF